MSRVKTFDSTGIATAGRLYAGDLNGMQDHYADLSNFSQTVDVGTLRLGDSSLQVVKFGSGELRATSALRIDGQFLPGSFTTTQRNALVSPPSGTMLWNSTTGQLEVNIGSSGSPSWRVAGISNDSLTAAMIAAGAVGTSELADGSITPAKLAATDGLQLRRSTNIGIASNAWANAVWNVQDRAEGSVFWNSGESFDLLDAGWHEITGYVNFDTVGAIGVRIIDRTAGDIEVARSGTFSTAGFAGTIMFDFKQYRAAANEYMIQVLNTAGGALAAGSYVTARIER